MIGIHDLTAALARVITQKTGLPAFDRRLKAAVYPAVYVEAAEKSTALIAGGRQVLRRLEVRLVCLPDREREAEGVGRMAHTLYGALLPWFAACGRRFAPEELSCGGREGNIIQFWLEFCDLPPQGEAENTQLMDSIALALGEPAPEQGEEQA